MIRYDFITKRISQGVYQHTLYLGGRELNIGKLTENSRVVIDKLGEYEARTMEITGAVESYKKITIIDSLDDIREALAK